MTDFVADKPEFTVEEDEYHNIILVFQTYVEKNPGDKILVWSSAIADKAGEQAQRDLAVSLVAKLKAKPNWTRDEIAHLIASIIVIG